MYTNNHSNLPAQIQQPYYVQPPSLRSISPPSTFGRDKIELNAGVYKLIVNKDGMNEYKPLFPEFKVAPKLYGQVNRDRRDKIIADYAINPKFGVMLTGLKGSGKTELMFNISNHLIKHSNVPVLYITEGTPHQAIRHATLTLKKAIIIIEEITEIFSDKENNEMISMFSDANVGEIMFIITTNWKSAIPDAMKDRPGRFKYSFAYMSLDEGTVDEYLADTIENEAHRTIIRDYAYWNRTSMDVLKTVAEIIVDVNDEDMFYERVGTWYNVPVARFLIANAQPIRPVSGAAPGTPGSQFVYGCTVTLTSPKGGVISLFKDVIVNDGSDGNPEKVERQVLENVNWEVADNIMVNGVKIAKRGDLTNKSSERMQWRAESFNIKPFTTYEHINLSLNFAFTERRVTYPYALSVMENQQGAKMLLSVSKGNEGAAIAEKQSGQQQGNIWDMFGM